MSALDFETTKWIPQTATVSVFRSSTKEAETNVSGTRTVAVALQHDGLAAPGPLSGSPTGSIQLSKRAPVASFRAVLHSDLDSSDPLSTALVQLAAYSAVSGDTLRACSEADWAGSRWQSGIEVSGNLTVAQALNSSLYHLLAAGVPDWPFSYTPSGLGYGGLMPQPEPKSGGILRLGYFGHVFWDSDLWISTGLALLRPDLTGMIVEYRAGRLQAALDRAQQYGFEGANWPWESAFTGVDCVKFPNIEGEYEQHISSDIALNLRWLYRLTGNTTWLKHVAWPMLQPTCQFWHCRFERLVPDATPTPVNNCGVKTGSGNFTILNVQPPDERAGLVNSSIYTNAAAAAVLEFCVEAASVLGESGSIPVAEYTEIATSVYLPISSTLWPGHAVHPEFAGYDGQQINQASVTLTQWPLQWPIGNASVRLADLEYYAGKVPFNGMFTGDASLSVAALELGNRTLADELWQLGLEHDNTPFGVWKERAATIGNPNFITGVGGMLQNVLNGFFGMRAPGNRTLGFFAPSLPLDTDAMTIRGLQFQGNRLQVSLDLVGTFCARLLRNLPAAMSAVAPHRWSPSTARLERLLRTPSSVAPFRLSSGSSTTAASLVLVGADGMAKPIVAEADVCTSSTAGKALLIQTASDA